MASPIEIAKANNPDRICTAMLSDRSARCKKFAIRGSNVCPSHGAKAPQVKRKAAEVVQEARDRLHTVLLPLAIQRLEEIAKDKRLPAPDRLRAALAIMDRTGMGPGSTIQIEAEVKVLPPAEMLRDAMSGRFDRMLAAGLIRQDDIIGDIVEAEIVEDVDDGAPVATVIPMPLPDFI